MKTTADYMDALRAKHGIDSDNKLAAFIGTSRQHMSRYRNQLHAFDDAMSLKVAHLLDVPAEDVLLDMQIQRETNEVAKAAWKRIAERLTAVTAALAIVAIMPIILIGNYSPDLSYGFMGLTSVSDLSAIYIMRILN